MLKGLEINRLQWFRHITWTEVNTIFRRDLELQEKEKDPNDDPDIDYTVFNSIKSRGKVWAGSEDA
jgi:hypothetical protein